MNYIKNKLRRITLILFMSYSSLILTADIDEGKKLLERVSYGLSECAAFYAIVSIAMENSGENKGAVTFNNQAMILNEYAKKMAHAERSEEMVQKVVMARFELLLKSHMKEIDGDASNISILSNKYLETCQIASNNPDKFFELFKK